ncbi:hypothetical protein [[Mycoplasma] anseris]|uniref:Uncharacterized protein n=1 Tax=[Mycoplasma] anseris TaxID=92400 RepID=A0A2Z4NCT8_9BACT|nr:hypothetical protein [[Mycoplasma] anseris]AWX69317.1 hypothetical protein DP065_00920 [[Mycoplasma] anseris]
MNNQDINQFEEFLKEIENIREQDPLKAIYLIDQKLKTFLSKEFHSTLEALRDDILFQIKKNELKTKTNLNTLELINSLKNKKMDYIFMLNYNQLRDRKDVKEYASEFQLFFNGQGFDNDGFQTLIYDLLADKMIDYDYQVANEIINPNKLGSFLKNPEIKKIQNELFNSFSKDVAKYKIASQVFSAYLFENWVSILLNKSVNEYQTISNVVEVLMGNKNQTELNEAEHNLYKLFI